jgi:tetratricopeptide (TPR) repeat protein/transcriptional regulator with XRE-family HTH domain
MERQAYVEPLALGGKIARYCDDPAQAIDELVRALARNFPPAQPASGQHHEATTALSRHFLDQLTESTAVDIEALTQFRAEFREEIAERYPPTVTAWEFLSRESLWTDGRLTLTGALLFAMNPTAVCPTSMVKCVQYHGSDRTASRDIHTFDGTVPAQIVASRQFVADRVRSGEGPSAEHARLTAVYEYPMVAVREIIANALVHRDYATTDSCVHVRLFEDRLEVSSPGPWVGRDLNPELEYEMSALIGQSRKRNYRLAHVLSYIKLVEGEGSGIPASLRSCEALQSPTPTVVQEDGFITVILRRREFQEGDGGSLSFGERLKLLRRETGRTIEELSRASGVPMRSISDLERGITRRPRAATTRQLADALGLEGPIRTSFEEAAQGRPTTGSADAVGGGPAARTLPRATASFTAREEELARISEAASRQGENGGICVISGMAGVGKTALALVAAHRLADQFPDGQLFLDLHGYTDGLEPLSPVEALGSLLRSLGATHQVIPDGLEERAAFFRSRLAGTRTLIVLDNAVGTAQVRPLLPGTAGCLVIVTSRRMLTGLDDATTVALDVLPEAAAVDLFRAIAGPENAPAAGDALAGIVALCGHLPLALRIVAARLKSRPALTLADLTRELRHEHGRLRYLQDEDRNLTAAMSLSYQSLPSPEKRVFAQLGLIPGPDFDAYTAACLTETEIGATTDLLDSLINHNLLAQDTADRYRFHELVRMYARTLGPSTPTSAIDRLLDYYLYEAQAADRRIERPFPAVSRPAEVAAPAVGPRLDTPARARAWVSAELANLDAAVYYAAGNHRPAHAVGLAAAIGQYLNIYGPWTQAIAMHHRALEAARDADDRYGEAGAHAWLGGALRLTSAFAEATMNFTRALSIYRELADRDGQARMLADLGIVERLTGDYQQAEENLGQALDMYRDLGNRLGQAGALAELGSAQRQTGAFERANASLTGALGLYRELGNRLGEAVTRSYLGSVQLVAGAAEQAEETLTVALDIYSELGDRLGQANTLLFLGGVRRETTRYAEATANLTRAWELYSQLGERRGQAAALAYLGFVQKLTADYDRADTSLAEALELFRELHDRGGEAETLNMYAALARATGAFQQARARYSKALDLARDIASARDEADALEGIGMTYQLEGDLTEAAIALRQALALYESLGCATDASRVQAALRR